MNCNNRITYDDNCNTHVQENIYDSNYTFVYVLQFKDDNKVFIKTKKDLGVIFTTGIDGLYSLTTLKISKDENDEYYYKDNKFYHQGEEIELDLLLEINPQVSGLDVSLEYYFQTCRLEKCFIKTCLEIFKLVNSCRTNLDFNLTYKRDLLWSALNVIKYMVEKELFEEALNLLDRIMGCNGLCDNSEHPCKCGCS